VVFVVITYAVEWFHNAIAMSTLTAHYT